MPFQKMPLLLIFQVLGLENAHDKKQQKLQEYDRKEPLFCNKDWNDTRSSVILKDHKL